MDKINWTDILNKIKFFLGLDDYEDDNEYELPELYPKKIIENKNVYDKTVETKSSGNYYNGLEIYVIEEYQDITLVLDDLKAGKSIVVNLQKIERDIKRQVFDFLNGGVYALNSTIQKVDREIFVVSPYDIEENNEYKTPSIKKHFLKDL